MSFSVTSMILNSDGERAACALLGFKENRLSLIQLEFIPKDVVIQKDGFLSCQ